RLGMGKQMREGPGQRRGRRLVSRQQEREQLVDEIVDLHLLASLVACVREERQDVRPARGALRPAAADLTAKPAVNHLAVGDEAANGETRPRSIWNRGSAMNGAQTPLA